MLHTYPFFIEKWGMSKMDLWFGMNPISAGVFGLPAGLLTIIIVSMLTAAPDKETQEFVEHVRYPNLKGDTLQTEAT
jgi:cation/acetate symporter